MVLVALWAEIYAITMYLRVIVHYLFTVEAICIMSLAELCSEQSMHCSYPPNNLWKTADLLHTIYCEYANSTIKANICSIFQDVIPFHRIHTRNC